MTLRNIHDKINVWRLNQVSPRVARDYLHLRLWSYFQPSLNQAFFFFKTETSDLRWNFSLNQQGVDGLVQLVAYLFTIHLQIHAFCQLLYYNARPSKFHLLHPNGKPDQEDAHASFCSTYPLRCLCNSQEG